MAAFLLGGVFAENLWVTRRLPPLSLIQCVESLYSLQMVHASRIRSVCAGETDQ